MRTLVLPVLRLLVWTVIAAALVVLAFRGGTGDADPVGASGPPGLDLSSPAVPVARGTVTNTVTVEGTVAADADVPVKATSAGEVRRIIATPGSRVEAGAALLEIRWEEERDPVVGVDAEGNPTSTPRDPLVRSVTVTAPAAGTVAEIDVLKDQVVAVGDVVGALSPGTLSVTAPITQADQFRLLSPPSSAEITVRGGPAPFTCSDLTLGAPPADAGSGGGIDPMTGMPTQAAASQARCTVPGDVTVFSGMAATMAINAGEAVDVLVVPATAVQGAVQNGTVWVPGADGTPEERPVTLGLTDGQQVEITGGLTEGESVLQFVPVPDDTPTGPGMGGGWGG
ncbi:efflux RND transporter periplasmic adaptor subunit [Modestobacter sp. SYSU DS0290]